MSSQLCSWSEEKKLWKNYLKLSRERTFLFGLAWSLQCNIFVYNIGSFWSMDNGLTNIFQLFRLLLKYCVGCCCPFLALNCPLLSLFLSPFCIVFNTIWIYRMFRERDRAIYAAQAKPFVFVHKSAKLVLYDFHSWLLSCHYYAYILICWIVSSCCVCVCVFFCCSQCIHISHENWRIWRGFPKKHYSMYINSTQQRLRFKRMKRERETERKRAIQSKNIEK